MIRFQGNESSDTQIGAEEASDGANTEVDLDAVYRSDSTQDTFECVNYNVWTTRCDGLLRVTMHTTMTI